MPQTFPGTIVISRDGALGIHLVEFEGQHHITGRDATGFYFTVLLNPRADHSRIAVLFSGWTTRIEWGGYGLPDVPDAEARLLLFCEAAIGDYLDETGLPPFTPSGVSAVQVPCFSERTAAWAERQRASDEEIDAYIEAKVYWAWKYELGAARFTHPDCLRLGNPLSSLQRVALVGEGERWMGAGTLSGGEMVLTATPALLRTKKTPVRAPGTGAAEVAALLSPPRYAGPRAHWQKAMAFSAGETRDTANAVKEAICAVEGLCRLITGRPTATLGDLIKELRATGRIDGSLAKTLEGIWGFASNSPGVCHGASAEPTIDDAAARLTIDTCEAALRFLLDLDR